jgi:hypothetical protein
MFSLNFPAQKDQEAPPGDPVSMYCWSCGHKNSDDNKFCGECGKQQVRPPVFAEDESADNRLNTMNPPAEKDRRIEEHRENRSPRISTLSRGEEPARISASPVPPPGTGITPTQRLSGTNPLVEEPRAVKDSPLAQTPIAVETPVAETSASSTETRRLVSTPIAAVPGARAAAMPMRISGPSFLGLSDPPDTADYLLDEEQDEGSSTARTYIALALILLFGVLIYKQWDSVSAYTKDLAQRAGATTTASDDSANAPASSDAGDPATPEVAANSDATKSDSTKTDQKPESDNASAADQEKAAADIPESAGEGATDEDATKKETAPPEPKADAAKPPKNGKTVEEVATAPVYDDSQIELAQKYLQGRGVAQDCNRGIRLLRSAASQPNPKAQIKLGALYATGYCVDQDRAEAYRWFAEAHQLQPGNQWIDRNLNTLWSEMTTAERARAQR